MPRPVEAARPQKVNGFWFLVRRVPAEFAAYDTRKLVRQSTGIRIVDDPRAVRAGEVVAKLHSELIRYWKDKRRGRDRDGEARYEITWLTRADALRLRSHWQGGGWRGADRHRQQVHRSRQHNVPRHQ
jgi:hypothetical protein